jgi:hypothetical protein
MIGSFPAQVSRPHTNGGLFYTDKTGDANKIGCQYLKLAPHYQSAGERGA